jgi:hypothetical protein
MQTTVRFDISIIYQGKLLKNKASGRTGLDQNIFVKYFVGQD